jgi:transcriptional regulator with XRE-family HTH domain
MATRIRELRLKRAELVPTAFTVTALARRLGVSEVSLRSWERGANRPTRRHARALARELGVTVDELALREGVTTTHDGT